MATVSKSAYKSRVIFTGIVVAAVLIGFQNCGKTNTQVEPPSLQGTVEQKPSTANLMGSDHITLLKTHNGFTTFRYDINLVNGLVNKTYFGLAVDDKDYVEEVLCLTDAKRQSLADVTNSSSVCLYKPTRDDIECAMIYRPPYAFVYQTKVGVRNIQPKEYALGENASACTEFYDICQETRADFLAVVQDVLSDIDSSVCLKQ